MTDIEYKVQHWTLKDGAWVDLTGWTDLRHACAAIANAPLNNMVRLLRRSTEVMNG